MKIFIGADHRGFELKTNLIKFLKDLGHEVEDKGAFDYVPNDDYVDFATAVAEAISHDPNSRGIVLCGSGIGVDIVVNKFPKVRCGLAICVDQIIAGREDDDINVLAIASDFNSEMDAQNLAVNFLETAFNPTENHKRRVEKINILE
jgi:ribose 5-phosphate isomerase B